MNHRVKAGGAFAHTSVTFRGHLFLDWPYYVAESGYAEIPSMR